MTKFRGIYLAYPIDQAPMASSAWIYDFINQVKFALMNERLASSTFDPGDAFKVGSASVIGPEIEGINAYAQATMDLTIAFLPTGVPTIGVPMEIDRAAMTGKTTVVFTDVRSWSLAGHKERGNVKIVPLSEEGLEEAVTWLHERPLRNDDGSDQGLDPLPVVRIHERALLPSRGYHDDAGLDLYVDGPHIVMPQRFLDIPCGIKVELPEWGWGLLTGRSSTLRKKGLLVHQAVIDAGYRGPLFAGVWNMTAHPVEVKDGERIAQLIVLPNTTKDLTPVLVEALSDHPRGESGFGSTGA